MGIYTRLAAKTRDVPEVHDFWMSMARHEAAHVGALSLVGALLEESDRTVELRHAPDVVATAQTIITPLHEEASGDVSLERGFAIAVELESQELEEVVLDLVQVLPDPAARSQARQMLIHDLSDLSLMIEKHCGDDDALLARADAVIERHVCEADGEAAAKAASSGSTK